MSRWFEFLCVDVKNTDVADATEMVIRPTKDKDAIMTATFKGFVECGKDAITGPTSWSSRGSTSADWYDGRPPLGRLTAKRSKGVLDGSDPVFKSLPAHAKSHIMFAATCVFANAKDRDGTTLFNIGRAMNGQDAATMAACPTARIDSDVSLKRLSHHTSITTHTIVAHPNMSSAVTLSRPIIGSDNAGSNKLDQLANAVNTNVSIKAIQNVARYFTMTFLTVRPVAAVGSSLDFGIRPGTLVKMDDDLFAVKDEDTLTDAMDAIREVMASYGTRNYNWADDLGRFLGQELSQMLPKSYLLTCMSATL